MKETRYKNYFVTEDGKVFSNKTGILKPMAIQTRKDGYQVVRVNGNSLVHRLVADTFVENVDGKTVNHLDGKKSHNHKDNLEVVTVKQNIAHALETGLTPIGENHSRAKFSDELLMSALGEIKAGASVNATAKKFPIARSYLNKVKNKEYRGDLWDKV